jgi:hypothetical protein
MLIMYNPELEFTIERTGDLLDEYLGCFYGSFLLMVGDNINPKVRAALHASLLTLMTTCSAVM